MQVELLANSFRILTLTTRMFLICIVRYIQKAPRQGQLHKDKENAQILGFYDANWVDYPIDKISTIELCIRCSKKQSAVAQSSAEAEYSFMALATCELVWFKQLF